MTKITGEPDAVKAARPVRRGLVGKVPHGEHDGNSLACYPTLQAEISIWVKTRIPENAPFDLHDCKRRARLMARQNIKAQYQRVTGDDSPVFLGLEPPADGPAVFTEPAPSEDRGAGYADPIYVATVGVGLAQKVNQGDYNNIVPAYTDWADVRTAAHNAQSDLHIALSRLWDGLRANMRDEIARAQGDSSTEDNFGLPPMEVEDLTGETEDSADKPDETAHGNLLMAGNGRNHKHHNGNGRP